MITSAIWQNLAKTHVIITSDTGEVISGVHSKSRFWAVLQDWIASGNTPDPADPPSPPPTNDEIYDQVIQSQKVFKGYVLAVNDGSIVPGSNMTGAQLKAAVKTKM